MKNDIVWKEINKHWSIIIDQFSQNYDINNLRLRTRQGKDKLPHLEIIEKPRRNKKEYLVVEFEKGIIISSKNINDKELFIEVINRVGIDDVEALNLETQGGIPIIIDKTDGNIKKEGYTSVGKKLVYTKTGIDLKKSLIENIFKKLKRKAKVSISSS